MHSVSPALDVGVTFGKKFPLVDGWHGCGQRSNKTVHGVFLHTTEAPPATGTIAQIGGNHALNIATGSSGNF
jgi:hypothetical protein